MKKKILFALISLCAMMMMPTTVFAEGNIHDLPGFDSAVEHGGTYTLTGSDADKYFAPEDETLHASITAPVVSANIDSAGGGSCTGTVGTPIDAKPFKLTFTGVLLKNIPDSAEFTSWMKNMPTGLRVVVAQNYSTVSEVRMTIDGIPTVARSADFDVIIPKEKFQISPAEDITVTAGTNARWEIAALEQVATPTFSPAGGNYSSVQNVILSSTTTGADIRYTTDGSTPNMDSPMYTTAIHVSSTMTIKAIAVKGGMTNSEVASAAYTINIPGMVSAPAFNPAGGTYNTTQNVTLSSATEGATIYYTTNGDAPTTSSTQYESSTPIAVSSSTTIKAIAVKNGMTDSEIASASYVIETPAPGSHTITTRVSPLNGGSVTGGGSVADGGNTTLSATANQGYKFVKWMKGDSVVSTSSSYEVTNVREDAEYIAVFKKKASASKDDDDEEESRTSGNQSGGTQQPLPDILQFTYPADPINARAFRAKQGPLCELAFRMATPAGYQEAFSFNLFVNGKAMYDPRQRTLTLILPKEYQKGGRTFALNGINKNGTVQSFANMAASPTEISVNIEGFEGYAFDVIYTDGAVTVACPSLTKVEIIGSDEKGNYYIVQKGDSLSQIADLVGKTKQSLVDSNGMDDPDKIRVGQKIYF